MNVNVVFSRLKDLLPSKFLLKSSCFILYVGIAAHVHSQTIAFPGAEGYGKNASGGRGGQVVEVTSLEDSGPGTFRWAIDQFPGEPITIVFKTGGLIELKSNLVLKRSDVTIAGQTAPGDGICLKNFSFIVSGAGKGGNKGNVIIRYLRSRPGGTIKTGLYGFDMENCHDVIIDHCSFSWANEECAAMYDMKNTTVQWSIVSEGLYEAGHAKGHRSYGGVWGGQYASYHHNLIAHQNSRAVRFNGSRAHDTVAIVDYRNNVIYNWGNPNASYGGDVKINGGVSQVNMVGNYYKPGPATPSIHKFIQALDAGKDSKGVGQWYLEGNIIEGDKALTKDNWLGVDLLQVPENLRSNAKSRKPFEISAAIKKESANDAYKNILAHVGAVLPKRDATDERVINEVKTGTATGMGVFGKAGIIDSPAAVGGWASYQSGTPPPDSDHDGMPDDWEKKKGLNVNDPSDRNKVLSGYTMLEHYLNELAAKYNGL